jgi:hypothetical protein
VERLDAADLRALASASRALLSSVARDARDQARHLADRHRDRKADSGPARRGPPEPPASAPPVARRPRRFKRRWVVVPVLVTVVIVLLLLVGLGLLVAAALGLI